MHRRIDRLDIRQRQIDIREHIRNHLRRGEAGGFHCGMPAFLLTGFQQFTGEHRLGQRFAAGKRDAATGTPVQVFFFL
ncbi:hypothetical protein D3C80_1840300 [compost metagenome]